MVDDLIHPTPAADRRREQSTLAWWTHTVVETIVLFAIIVGFETAVGDGRIGGYGVHPHPYWLVVLPVAAARGMVASLVAATVASVLYGIGAHEARGGGPIAELIGLDAMLEPLLFFIVGFVVGEFRDVIRDRLRTLGARLAETTVIERRVRSQRDVLRVANLELERRLVDHTAQFGNLIRVALRVEDEGAQGIYEIALEMVEEHCGATASVIAPVATDCVDALCHRGWERGEDARYIRAARESELVARALRTGAEANGLDGSGEAPREGPVLVVPLCDRQAVVRALLCLDELPLSRLNAASVRTFRSIAAWASSALRRIDSDAVNASMLLDPEPMTRRRVETAGELASRLRVEVERCARYGVPLSVVGLQFTEWTDVSDEGLARLYHFVQQYVVEDVRVSDSVHRFGYPGCFVVVLAGTSVDRSDAAARRIRDGIPERIRGGFGSIEILALSPDTEAPSAQNLVHELAEWFTERGALPFAEKPPFDIPSCQRAGTALTLAARLRTEVALAARHGHELQIVELLGTAGGVIPGLVAHHVEQVAQRILRPTDAVYAVGPSHVALVLPHTDATAAEKISGRVREALSARDPDAPYGAVSARVLGLDATLPDAEALMAALAATGAVATVASMGDSR